MSSFTILRNLLLWAAKDPKLGSLPPVIAVTVRGNNPTLNPKPSVTVKVPHVTDTLGLVGYGGLSITVPRLQHVTLRV